MKKKFALLTAGAVWIAAGVQAGGIAFVDLQEVFKGYYKTEVAQMQIQQQSDDIRAERQDMELQLVELRDEIDQLRVDARDKTLSEEIRAAKRNAVEEKLVALQEKEKEMIEFEKLRQQQIQQQNERTSKKIYDEIKDAVQLFAKEKGYDAVIDQSAQSRTAEVVMYVSPMADITGHVLHALNKGRPSGMDEKKVAE